MAYRIRTRDEHFCNDGTPKRILALDGGGLRGILSLAYLAEIESLLRTRHGGSQDFRLHHYFDLIAGTSTGSIIAAALARGMAVEEIIQKYNALGQRVFQKSWLRQGYVRAFYDESGLIHELKEVYGAATTMGDASVQTGLLVITQVQPIAVMFAIAEDMMPAILTRLRGGATLPVDVFNRDNTQHLSTGRLVTSDNQVDPTTGTVKLKAMFDNASATLFPNQFVNARLTIDTLR